MSLRDELLRGIYSYGFEKPSAIQMRGILPILDGNDTIAQAQSGTGKTATFAIATLQKVDLALNACQALILAPTRELAQQIQKVVIALGDYMNARIHACIGGTAVREDLRILSKGVQVVVGTQGRVFDVINCGCSRGPIGEWDISSVVDMTGAFRDTAMFDGDVSKWDVSSVTSMSAMFTTASFFNGDLSKWDVSSITSMSAMFAGAA